MSKYTANTPGVRLLLSDIPGHKSVKLTDIRHLMPDNDEQAGTVIAAAFRTRDARFAKAALLYLLRRDRKISKGNETRPSRLLSMTAPAPEPSAPALRGNVGASQLEWLDHSYSKSVDEHGNQELHEDDVLPVRLSRACYTSEFLKAVYDGKIKQR
jgi:hypothetical protein